MQSPQKLRQKKNYKEKDKNIKKKKIISEYERRASQKELSP
jgi:hypothetical protein